jgi:threonine dehydratase
LPIAPACVAAVGQGSVAAEMLSQIPQGNVEVCIVPVGGGGLIGGIAAVLKAANPSCLVVGAQPAASDVMRQSVAAGCIVDAPSGDTLSDATAGESDMCVCVCVLGGECSLPA